MRWAENWLSCWVKRAVTSSIKSRGPGSSTIPQRSVQGPVLFDFIIKNLDAETESIFCTPAAWRHPWYQYKFLYHHTGEAWTTTRWTTACFLYRQTGFDGGKRGSSEETTHLRTDVSQFFKVFLFCSFSTDAGVQQSAQIRTTDLSLTLLRLNLIEKSSRKSKGSPSFMKKNVLYQKGVQFNNRKH